jgi:hypothetical protein
MEQSHAICLTLVVVFALAATSQEKPPLWLDWSGHSQTEMLHVVERYRRPDLGHLELEMTVEDRGALKESCLIKRT